MVLDNARQVAPDDAAVWNRLGFVELAMGNRPQALEAFKKAASLQEDYAEAHVNYGNLLVDAEDFLGARKELELAVRYARDSAPAHLGLANALRGLKDLPGARAEYEQALALDPSLVDANFDLGILYLDVEDPSVSPASRYEQAIAFFDAYRQKGGDEPRLAQYRKDAQVLLDKEKKRLAREEKEKLRKAAEAKKKEDAAAKVAASTSTAVPAALPGPTPGPTAAVPAIAPTVAPVIAPVVIAPVAAPKAAK